MVRQAKWIVATALGLLLAWDGTLAQAQRFSFDDEPMPGPSVSDDDAADGTSDSDESMDDESNSYSDDSDNYQNEDESTDSYRDDSPSGDSQAPAEQTEPIKERYPNGAIKVERHTTQDAAGNYLNHGPWKMYDQRGNLVAQGQYKYGNRNGTWIRWYRSVTEVPLLTKPPFNSQYVAPFISQATFTDGLLNGYWTIYDGKMRKISQWRFVDGHRQGLSTWWHPNGRKMREIEFRDGEIDGHVTEWGPEGTVLLNETYRGGRKLAQKTSHYNGGKKKSEGMYLFARDVEKLPDDWWNCTTGSTIKTGKDEKHGAWTSWYPTGQRQLEGTYEHDLQVGLFTWWHANGQKALEGRYDHGKQDGTWVWWYQTGQKSIQGEYAHGNPTGRWTWWNEDGKVAQSADLSGSEGVVIQQLPSAKPQPLPNAKKAAPKAPVRR